MTLLSFAKTTCFPCGLYRKCFSLFSPTNSPISVRFSAAGNFTSLLSPFKTHPARIRTIFIGFWRYCRMGLRDGAIMSTNHTFANFAKNTPIFTRFSILSHLSAQRSPIYDVSLGNPCTFPLFYTRADSHTKCQQTNISLISPKIHRF